MTFLLFVMGGVGVGLAFAGINGINPSDMFRSILTGKQLPANNSWRPIGITAIGGRIGGGSDDKTPLPADAPELQKRLVVIEWARAQLGKRYVFGAAGPNEYDCSGLTMRAYERVGVGLPHNAAMQQLRGVRTNSPLPGDLVFWGAASGHVAIYVGEGRILHAPQAGDVVKITGLWDEDIITYRSYL